MISSSTDQRHLYSDLTWLWPIVSPPEDYIGEAAQFLSSIREHAPASRSVLNLGCGGGHLDQTLKKHFAVTGIDISEPMLALAKQLNPDVHYITGDMRTARLDQTFDAVMVISPPLKYINAVDPFDIPCGPNCAYALKF